MRRLSATLFGLLCLVNATPGPAAEAYTYPIDDPFMATVVGTPPLLRAELPEKIPLKAGKLTVFPSRKVPEVVWYNKDLYYSYALQKGEAPLIFCIAGTGAFHNSGKNTLLMRAFYAAGFHVVGISSPTHANFVVAASATGVPGHLYHDAEDLYRVMELIRAQLGDRLQVARYFLTGYSLGAANAAFVAHLDGKRRQFNFDKVLLINAPVSLYNSISRLDRMLQSIPGGMDNLDRYYADIVKRVTKAYTREDTVEFTEEMLYKAFEDDLPSDEQLASLIGIAFRLSSSSMIFTSDVMTNFGMIKPKDEILGKNTSLGHYLEVSLRVGFTDYYHDYFYPYYQAREHSLTREALAEYLSLRSIEDFLHDSKYIGVVHNEDDVILARGEIDFFRDVFGKRARIWPHGGHLGNLAHRQVMDYIVRYFTRP